MTTQTSFSFNAMVKSGYQIFKHHAQFLILAGLATFIVQIILQMIQRGSEMSRGSFLIGILASLFVGLISIIISIGWSKVFLKLGRGDGATWNDFKSEPSLWIKFIKTYIWYLAYFITYLFLASIAFLILAGIGFAIHSTALSLVGAIFTGVAVIVIAVYFSIRYKFLKYVILDNQTERSRDIFKKAGSITKGSLLQLLGLSIVLGLINLVGFICLVVGLMVTLPTTKIAEVKVYEYLKETYSA